MSKSDPAKLSRIHITTPPTQIEQTVKMAASDNLPGIFTAADRPGITNLLQILSAFEDTPISALEGQFAGMQDGGSVAALKERTAQAVIRELEPVRERYKMVQGNKEWLGRARQEGNERAREFAKERIKEIKESVGLTHG